MSTVAVAVPDELTISMTEVDAAAARAALAGRLQLARVDLEHPAVVAVLAAVVAAGWRPPITPGGNGSVTDPVEEPPSMALFGECGFGESAESPAAPATLGGWPW